jgi:hypothetical protein
MDLLWPAGEGGEVVSAEEPGAGDLPDASAVITGEDQATWALDHILTQRERLERIKRSCADMIASAQSMVDDAERYYLPELERWAKGQLTGKKRSLKLPTGQLAFRTVPAGLRVLSEAEALAWAKQERPDLVRVKESVLVSELKAHFDQTGELPAGAERTEGRDSFSVKG